MHTLENDVLQIKINSIGAELSSIRGVKSNLEFLWQADPKIWGSHAPNLFPIVGAMKNDTYYYDSESYNMPKHGFVRHNTDFEISLKTNSKIEFRLKSNAELKTIYPFDFEFNLTYQIEDNCLYVHHTVKNIDNRPIYFSLGGHPAFNCPLYNNESYSDYELEFEQPESSESYILNTDSGLISNKTKPVFTDSKKIQLKPDLFNADALIFKDLKSKKVALKHKEKGTVLSVRFNDFPYLGIWAKPNAPYVCIEPWIGLADSENTNQQLTKKEGIVKLDVNSTFKANYSIEIDERHLD
jgi:galactose mutarotase-like enzyme